MIYEGAFNEQGIDFRAAGQRACWELLFRYKTDRLSFKNTETPPQVPARRHARPGRTSDGFSVSARRSFSVSLSHTPRGHREPPPECPASPTFLWLPPQLQPLCTPSQSPTLVGAGKGSKRATRDLPAPPQARAETGRLSPAPSNDVVPTDVTGRQTGDEEVSPPPVEAELELGCGPFRPLGRGSVPMKGTKLRGRRQAGGNSPSCSPGPSLLENSL